MRRWVACLLVITVSFLMIVLADQYLRTREQAREVQALEEYLMLVAARLENRLQGAAVALERLAEALSDGPPGVTAGISSESTAAGPAPVASFEAEAARLRAEQGFWRTLRLVARSGAPHAQVPAGREPGPARRISLPSALGREAPVRLVPQLSPAYWAAVFRGGALWGGVRGELDLERLLEQVQRALPHPGAETYALRLVSEERDAPGVLAGVLRAPADEIHGLALQVPHGPVWVLEGSWRAGPPPPDRVLRSFLWLFGGLFMLAALALVNRHYDYSRGVALAVAGRLKALREETRRLGREMQQRLAQERSLRQRYEPQAALLERCPAALFQTDGRGDWVYVNEAWCRLTGLDVRQSLGRGWMKGLEAADKERVLSQWYGAVRRGAPFSAELRFRRPDARGRPGERVWVLLYAAGDAQQGYVGVALDITARQELLEQNLEAARAEARQLQAVLDRLPAPYFRLDARGRLLQASRTLAELLDREGAELQGCRVQALLYGRHTWRDPLDALRRHGQARGRIELRHRDGHPVPALVQLQRAPASASGSEAPEVEGTVTVLVEEQAQEPQAAEGEESIQLLCQVLEGVAEAAMVTDPKGRIEYVNPAFTRLTGYDREEVRGRGANILKSGRHDSAFYEGLWRRLQAGQPFQGVFINRRKDGGLYHERKRIVPLRDEQGRIRHYVALGRVIPARVSPQEESQQETRLQPRQEFRGQEARQDLLTELPRRGSFMTLLEQAVQRARRQHRHLAVLILDLDGFRDVNDNFGLEAGDHALKIYARRLQSAVREGDLVARIGDDEFAVLADDVNGVAAVTRIAYKIIEVVAPPVMIDGRDILLTVSMGISIFPEDGATAQALVEHAMDALNRAKDPGHNSFQFYSSDMRAQAWERRAMEQGLAHALERGEFLLHYQPQLDLQGGGIYGVEALLRWQHPELGLLLPMAFVPLLEASGLIVPVGEWVLETAFHQGRCWHEAGYECLRMAVNLSSRQFNDPHFIDRIAVLIERSGIDPARLELELTESIIMRNTRATNLALARLDEMGVKFSIDDFGTGYSSLSYLKRFPIDILKIDRHFVQEVHHNPDDAAIVTAIIGLGHHLNLEVIAEGVERPEQLQFLRRNGCDAIQGYLFSQPLLPASLARVLREKQHRAQRAGAHECS